MTSASRVFFIVAVIVVLTSLAAEGVAMFTGIEAGLAQYVGGFAAGGAAYRVIARGDA